MSRRASLNLQNVRMVIKGPPCVSVLSRSASLVGHSGESSNRDWRKLRDRLPNLFTRDNYSRDAVAHWLDDAGYVAKSSGGHVAFTGRHVTGKVEQTVFEWARLVSWGMDTFDTSSQKRRGTRRPVPVAEQRRLARRYEKHLRNALQSGFAAPPTSAFFQEIGGAPADLNFQDLRLFLLGMGSNTPLSASLSFDQRYRPLIEVQTESPFHAITLTVFLDRVFTQARLAVCKWCGQKFSRRSTTQQFCPGTEGKVKHQSLWNTAFRRAKVKAVKDALKEVGKNWRAVARLATKAVQKKYPKEKVDITAKWARQEIEKDKKSEKEPNS